jgi:hypothetical protein
MSEEKPLLPGMEALFDSDELKKPPKPKRAPKVKPPSPAHLKLLDAAVDIALDRPSEDDAAYIARELVQCTMPHSNPGDDKPTWARQNGNLSLVLQQGYDRTGKPYGFPFGIIPRLVLFWLTTEAVKTKNPRLELGNSLAGFMHELGLSTYTGGGKRGDAKRLRDQMERLFRSRISFERTLTRAVKGKGRSIKQQQGQAWLDMQVAPKGELWWDEKDPEQPALWGSWIQLGEDFYRAITAAPVPVDIRALRALKRSPLALDLYAWLSHESYRAHKSGQGRFVAWSCLMEQLGAEYGTKKNFSAAARAALRKVAAVYPDLKLGSLRAGVRIDPESFPAIQPKPRQTIEGTFTEED